jgi:hypothetical protein
MPQEAADGQDMARSGPWRNPLASICPPGAPGGAAYWIVIAAATLAWRRLRSRRAAW